jgi:aryl-alcohol dehydrogenase-like predicted oxidoreductase
MTREEMTRREFVRSTSVAAAGAVTGALIGGTTAAQANKAGADQSKILNYHPQMGYRRLGKTNLTISEIGLGGHWRAPWRDTSDGWWWGKFAKEEVPEDVRKNRTEVVSKAIDCGMNYLDITGPEECLCYGAALKDRRDKMIVGADDYKLCPRHNEYCNTKAQIHNVEECLRRCGTDHLDLWRCRPRWTANTDADMEAMIEAFRILKKEGKVLHFGVSSHSRPWAQHVIEKYDAVEVFIFPCTAKTKQKDGRPAKNNVEEVAMKYGPDQPSVFQTLVQRDVGLITIKPFFGGSLFSSSNKAKLGAGSAEENELASLTLQCILNLQDAITCVIPGLSTIYEVENAARASHLRRQAMSAADSQWLAHRTEQRWSHLPLEYTWLHDWQTIRARRRIANWAEEAGV